ncbi:hypothetical protein [uncultured Campylobacter sp.]|uniref:hypothetical protein n=1 Tax=uncultured Campylobacter sp. TaxID=218934 RepID=UPI00262F9F8C|nr:hypothetical protein [uncultured Campylobacter sp.]
MHKLDLNYKVEISQDRVYTSYIERYTDIRPEIYIPKGVIRQGSVAANFHLATNGDKKGSAQYDFKLAVYKAKIYSSKIEESFILKSDIHSKTLAFCWRNRAYRPTSLIYKRVEQW